MFMARSLNIDKMLTFPKLIYRFNAVPIRISTDFFIEIGKLILKFIWSCKGSRISKTIVENKSKIGELNFPISNLTKQKDCRVLAQI